MVLALARECSSLPYSFQSLLPMLWCFFFVMGSLLCFLSSVVSPAFYFFSPLLSSPELCIYRGHAWSSLRAWLVSREAWLEGTLWCFTGTWIPEYDPYLLGGSDLYEDRV